MDVFILVEKKFQKDYKNKRKQIAKPFSAVIGVYQSYDEAQNKKIELNSREETRYKMYSDYPLDFVYEIQKERVI